METAFGHCVDSLFNGSDDDDDDEDQHPSSRNGGRHGNGGSSGEHGNGGNDGGDDDDDPNTNFLDDDDNDYDCNHIHFWHVPLCQSLIATWHHNPFPRGNDWRRFHYDVLDVEVDPKMQLVSPWMAFHPEFGVIIRSSLVYKVPHELCKICPTHSLASLPFADDMLVEAVGSMPRCHCCDKERHLMQECPSLSRIKSNERTHHSILHLLSCALTIRQVTDDTTPTIEEIS